VIEKIKSDRHYPGQLFFKSVPVATYLNWTDRLIRWCLYALMFSMSFGNSFVEIFINLAILVFIFETLILAFRSKKFSREDEVNQLVTFKKPLYAAIALYVAWNFISVLFSINFSQSIWAFYSKFLDGILIFFCCARHIKTRRHVGIFIALFLSGAFIASLNGFYQWFAGEDLLRGSTVNCVGDGKRVSGSFRHPNGFGAYLITIIPIVFSLVCGGRGLKSVFSHEKKIPTILVPVLWVLFLLLIVVLGLTFSRGAWVGLFFGMMILGFLKKRLAFVALTGLTVFFYVFYAASFSARDSMARQMQTASNQVFGSTIEQAGTSEYWFDLIAIMGTGRHEFWTDALGIIMQYPLTGTGINTYVEVLKTFPDAKHGWYAHNCYLQIAAETGVAGLILFLTVIIFFFRYFYSSLSAINDQLLIALLFGLLAGISAYLVHAFFDTTMYVTQLGFLHWIFMGLVIAIFNFKEGSVSRNF
jgi:putative inorganic carbon (hco3(-)) transporter